MSLRHILWALDTAPVSEPADVLILVSLAEFATEEGVAWPSSATIARRARVSRATYFRRRQALEAAGIIQRVPETETPSGWLRRRADRRPVAYRLVTSTGSQNDTPNGGLSTTVAEDGVSPGETPPDPRGLTSETHGVSLVRPEPRTEPTTYNSPSVVTSPGKNPPDDAHVDKSGWREAIALARQQRDGGAR